MDQSKLNKWSWRELQENMGEQVMIDGVICLLFWLDEKDREIFKLIMLRVKFHSKVKTALKLVFNETTAKVRSRRADKID